jgi:hypothetical protein
LVPGEYIERLLCALLGLVLNRKKDVEYGRHPIPGPARCASIARALGPYLSMASQIMR